MRFANRREAGLRLAAELLRYRDRHPIVYALPRGGVPVGYEIACRLGAPLDVILVRKLGAPISSELAIGAIVDGEPIQRFLNDPLIAELGVSARYIEAEIERQAEEIARRRRLYRHDRSPLDPRGRTAILVDDGIATGATMRVALRAMRRQEPARLVMAVPVAPAATIEAMRDEADEIVCLACPEDFGAIGSFYDDFAQLDDATVIALLADAARKIGASGSIKRPD